MNAPITTARYANDEHTLIAVNDNEFVPWPDAPEASRRRLQHWLDEGNAIQPFVQHFNQSDDELREALHMLNLRLAREKIEYARENPVASHTLKRHELTKQALRREARFLHVGAVPEDDDRLGDYIDIVLDELDSADDTLETMNRAQLLKWDGSRIKWPVWTPRIIT